MQLKKLQLFGFKTFADKTEINIDKGLTAIVGPNGCGKSNIVDALLWVLGEQNPRLLRGNSAQDVIFAGTDKRKPLGMAEVRLTVDNTDKTLPLDFAEVTVTRRIYRSGESQYLLNNAPCRLKDIVELFLDTGVGKGAYSFVTQSEIDAVLSAKPEDRRELFEEAAGIKKYRVKKREALRKLEHAEANLLRVRDILIELDAQREPMEKQALAAKRYLLLQERLREIEVGLLVAEIQTADYEIYAERTERESDQENLLTMEAELTHLEHRTEDLNTRLKGTEAELETAHSAHQTALTNLERTNSQLALLAERTQSAHRTGLQLAQELTSLTERTATLQNQIAFDTEEQNITDEEMLKKQAAWKIQQVELQTLEAEVHASLHRAEEQQAERLRLAQERARQETALKAGQDRLNESITRLERLTKEEEQLQVSLDNVASKVMQSEEATEQRKGELQLATNLRAQLEQRNTELQNLLLRSRSTVDSSRRLMAEQSARLNTLRELQESHEGFYQGVRAVLNAQKQGKIRGHYRAVVDLLHVPEPYRIAIEVALGGSLQDIVTETEAEAKAAIEWLKTNRAGRATFLPLPLLRSGDGIPTTAVRGAKGISGVALDLVDFDKQYDIVARMLLGRVVIAEDMDAAISLSRRLNGWSKIVTLDGELLTPSGALTGGSLQGKGTHLLGRKGEIDDLTALTPQTRTQLETSLSEQESLTTSIQALDRERKQTQESESALQVALASVQSQLSSAQADKSRLHRALIELQDTLSGVETQKNNLTLEISQRATLLERDLSASQETDDRLANLSDETRTLATQRDTCRARTVLLEVEVSRLKEKRDGLARSLKNDTETLENLSHQRHQKTLQQGTTESLRDEALHERECLLQNRTVQEALLQGSDIALNQWKAQRNAQLEESSALHITTRELTQKRSEITNNLHTTEVKLARLEVQLTQAVERLSVEYSISKEEALARPEEASIDRNTAMEVNRLRREVRGMGQVNTGAVEEYERLTERVEFLTTQQADIENGRASLLSTIAEIDDSTRGVFLQTYEAVKVEFDKIFQRLFDGGTTRLILTNPDDILETGIEVIAQPPGKKPQSLSLLSGGERALTATALLFAFLAVKPSPFVLLDEVDAPLDGANVAKFAELVRDFSQNSQFLIITHNPATMEATPTWYGITMRERGVSSVLSYRVPQEATPTPDEVTVILSEG
ncbi:MAG: chromosome segregation protein SMC [Armatimonadetes bacterium]|nr:chromosome segregation protein SMC [Armatimonadota bacterium]